MNTRDLLRRLMRSRAARSSLLLLAAFAAVGFAAPWLAPPDPACPSLGWNMAPDWVAQHLTRAPPCRPYLIPRDSFSAAPLPPDPAAWRSVPPDWHKHPFGTTQFRYDIYYGLVWGTRNALLTSLIIVSAQFLIGLAVGSTSGYYGGRLDGIAMRLVDFTLAAPGLFVILAFLAIFGRGLDRVIVAWIVVGWAEYARFARGITLTIRSREYIAAARVVGASNRRILARHVLPNILYPLLVLACLGIGGTVLGLSGLAFLGLSVGEGYADWGWMISASKDRLIGLAGGDPFRYWYTFLFPAAAILLFVLAWNVLGDAVRDAGDRRRGSGPR